MSEEVYKRPMFSMPAYRLFTLFLFFFFFFLLALGCSAHTLHCVAHRVINSGACLCKGWLP